MPSKLIKRSFKIETLSHSRYVRLERAIDMGCLNAS